MVGVALIVRKQNPRDHYVQPSQALRHRTQATRMMFLLMAHLVPSSRSDHWKRIQATASCPARLARSRE